MAFVADNYDDYNLFYLRRVFRRASSGIKRNVEAHKTARQKAVQKVKTLFLRNLGQLPRLAASRQGYDKRLPLFMPKGETRLTGFKACVYNLKYNKRAENIFRRAVFMRFCNYYNGLFTP